MPLTSLTRVDVTVLYTTIVSRHRSLDIDVWHGCQRYAAGTPLRHCSVAAALKGSISKAMQSIQTVDKWPGKATDKFRHVCTFIPTTPLSSRVSTARLRRVTCSELVRS